MSKKRKDLITEKLTETFSPVTLEVIDDSHKHKGHVGARETGGGHFIVKIVSEAFVGKKRLERHRMVYGALGDMMSKDIHALAIEAYEPGETMSS